MIEAAGGVIWRTSAENQLQVLIIHRPQRQDWTLPKGKLRRGEGPSRGALREVREETGLRCDLGVQLPDTRYVDRRGRTKRVQYWAMTVRAGRFRPNREVDRIRWIALDEVAEHLTNDHDIPVVLALVDVLALHS